MMVGGGKGVLRVLYAEPNHISDYMPVDVAIKAMITSCWKRGLITYSNDRLSELIKIHFFVFSSNFFMFTEKRGI